MNMNTKSQCIINPDTKLLIRDAPLGISVSSNVLTIKLMGDN